MILDFGDHRVGTFKINIDQTDLVKRCLYLFAYEKLLGKNDFSWSGYLLGGF